MQIKQYTRGAILAGLLLSLSACGTTGIMHENARKDNAANPGSDYSGSSSWVTFPGNIAGIPESNGKAAAMTESDVEAALDLDASCQVQLYHKTPDFGQAIVTEAIPGAVTTGGGETGFATQFPGTSLQSYSVGGAIVGALAGANTGRIRQEQAEKVAVNNCVRDFVNESRIRYSGHFEGVYPEPWVGDGSGEKPAASAEVPTLPHVDVKASDSTVTAVP